MIRLNNKIAIRVPYIDGRPEFERRLEEWMRNNDKVFYLNNDAILFDNEEEAVIFKLMFEL